MAPIKEGSESPTEIVPSALCLLPSAFFNKVQGIHTTLHQETKGNQQLLGTLEKQVVKMLSGQGFQS
ncbi:MAG: hypothetical protein V7K94_15215 [Nostoc sp.]|uniref:hypothetical protein n=1 Tax=Nostoc sp. TaxID=1180 RepID=UPI002FF53CC5